jgi:hypothetical protein
MTDEMTDRLGDSKGGPRAWGGSIWLLKSIALAVPWGVIESLLRSSRNLGFCLGVGAGLVCFYFAGPREPKPWILFLLGATACAAHLVLVHFGVV